MLPHKNFYLDIKSGDHKENKQSYINTMSGTYEDAVKWLACHRSPEDCAKDFDDALDGMLHYNGVEWIPKVCFCCDRLLLSTKEHGVMSLKRLKNISHLFKLKENEVELNDGTRIEVQEDVKLYYKYTGGGF